MKKIFYIILILLASKSNACDCFYFGGFAYSNQLADLVVYGKVIDYDSIGTKWSPELKMSIRFEIIEKYRGLEQKDTIEVLGDNGAECRPYISSFKPNEHYVLALYDYGNEYEISNCGEFHLLVENNYAKGKIYGREMTEPDKEIHIDKLKDIISVPYLYPITRKKDRIKTTNEGLEYHTLLKQKPKTSLTFDGLNRYVNKKIELPDFFADCNCKFLVHAKVIVTKENDLIFVELFRPRRSSIEFLIKLEEEIRKVLAGLEVWQCGYENGQPVNAELIIPIVIES